ncbi:MAG: M20/M25/M40 family metallo-hydrolase [Armatimonadota bacterium]|nr:M20/M25/M40 family metallo-hydrolase [Armatimonadota bacterium]
MEEEQAARVLDRIDREDLVALALDLANIDSPTGQEGAVGEYLTDTLTRWGLSPRRVGLLPDRFNVVARIPGTGDGRSLIFNSHMDTTIAKEEIWTTRRAADPVFHTGRREGDHLIGNGIVNNKGPMACWLVAAKALHESGIPLRGDLLLTMVAGEIGQEPVDEFEAPRYVAKETGARYLVEHGTVADYALVAEGTDFGVGWVEAGKAFFKVTVFGNDFPLYTPYIPRPTPPESSPSAIVRAAKLIEHIEAWAVRYEQVHRYEGPGGVVVPKVNIGAIRGGVPWKITKTAGVCALYVDVRITPAQNPLDVRDELRTVLSGAGVHGEVELYVYRPGCEGRGVEPLVQSIQRAHAAVRGGAPPAAIPPYTSMWRDINVFNALGIPAVIYGPGPSVGGGQFAMRIDDMVDAARAYALIALDVCNQPRPPAVCSAAPT